MRVVLDANIIIAAYAARGLCEAVFEYCITTDEIFLTKTIVADVHEKLVKKIKLPRAETNQIREFLQSHATIIEPAPLPHDVCRDPDDADILGAAQAAKADFIITGDDDLLILKSFRTTKILNPRAYWQQHAAGST